MTNKIKGSFQGWYNLLPGAGCTIAVRILLVPFFETPCIFNVMDGDQIYIYLGHRSSLQEEQGAHRSYAWVVLFISLYTNIRFAMISAFQFIIIIVQSKDSLFIKLGKCDGEKGEKILLGHPFLQHLLWYLCHLHTTQQSWLSEFIVSVLSVKYQNSQTMEQMPNNLLHDNLMFHLTAEIYPVNHHFLFAAVIPDWRISISKEEYGPVNNPYSSCHKKINKQIWSQFCYPPHPLPSPSCRHKGDQQLSARSKPAIGWYWFAIEISICMFYF